MARWWEDAEVVDGLDLALVRRLCGTPSLAAVRNRSGAVLRQALPTCWQGWEGKLAVLSTQSGFSMFPAVGEDQNTFSRTRHGVHQASVQPSVAFWKWLAAGNQAWQMRGEVKLEHEDLVQLLGSELAEAMAAGNDLQLKSASIWAGAGGTRTPLHVDKVHALVFQAQGTKRFFLSSRAAVEEAVFAGTLPEAVRDSGDTDAFCVDGTLDEVHGLQEPAPPRARGTVATLHAGDCLVLPAGLFHDVECAAGDPASMSLTVRFDVPIG